MNSPKIQRLTVKGSQVAYACLGRGPPVIMVHCSSASHREWLFAAHRLAGDFTCWLPDLMGYGKSPTQHDADGVVVPCRDVDIIDAIVDQAGEPADFIAHSYGAAVCLEYALERPERVKSLFLIEPVPFHLLNDGKHQREWEQVCNVAEKIIHLDATGQPKRAADQYMRFWLGRIQWAFAPRRFKSNVIKTIPKVAYEFSLVFTLPDVSGQLTELNLPTTLVSGNRSRAPALAVVDILAGKLPQSLHIVISGAGHMSPFTHSDQVMGLISEHLSNVSGGA
ncbi:MAG: alpha/beta hydrolase [Candidatus Thiodiazotropha sp. (ex Monitilora ramsayi)]|nr:alpha/beta hydrolase [Candidatus Thiodiazotropha sp. (ex Monitilora ramsayi)]